MDKLEKVEKIRQKTGASYTDAVQALDICNGDVLDAIVYLEQEGKINEQNVARFSSSSEENRTADSLASATAEYDKSTSRTTVGDGVDSFVAWAKKLFKKSVDTTFTVSKKEKEVLHVPVLVLVIALVFTFWIVLPLLVVGLFFDFRYHFEGVDKVTIDVNDFCDRAANGATSMRSSATEASDKDI